MICAVHSHAWQYPEHFTDQFRQQTAQVAKADDPLDLTMTYEGLYGLNKMLDGTVLPRLDEREIDALIHRDSLDILGL